MDATYNPPSHSKAPTLNASRRGQVRIATMLLAAPGGAKTFDVSARR
jgi:hypothetical protein